MFHILNSLITLQRRQHITIQNPPIPTVHLSIPFPLNQLLCNLNRRCNRLLRAIMRRVYNPLLHRHLRRHLLSSQHNITQCRRRSDLILQQLHEPIRHHKLNIQLTHVNKPSIFSHQNVIVSLRQNKAAGGGVAGYGGDCRHRERD
ncbi:hypothetical protein HanIR_Chr14g0720731 [Helianthus annuus]|nr:hypothetical protein HanIR_Chr14g0720731 [Helianthus annuus]